MQREVGVVAALVGLLLSPACGSDLDIALRDPLAQAAIASETAKLTPENGSVFGALPGDMAVDGNTLVLGHGGEAYVYERGASGWSETARLTHWDFITSFGSDVSLSGDVAVVASPDEQAAYVFVRAAGSWSEVKRLTAWDSPGNVAFAETISTSGDLVVAGARLGNAAYVFARNQGGADNWGSVIKLAASDAAAGDQFGCSVAASGDTVAVGARNDDDLGTDSGSVYVFYRNQGGADAWGEVRKLLPTDGAQIDHFGAHVAASGDIVAVTGDFTSGAYLFSRNQGGPDAWGQVRKLVPTSALILGYTVAASGDRIVVGNPYYDGLVNNSGVAHVFARDQGGADNWGEVKALIPADAAAGDDLGEAVAVSGDVVATNGYVFERNQGGADNWGEWPLLPCTGASAGDQFGISASVNGDVAAVGAPWDDVRGTTVTAGSVTIFTKGGSGWTEAKTLVNPDNTVQRFGQAVALSGDTLVATPDESFPNGAAFVFARNLGGADNWGLVKKLVSTDGGYIGQSAAVSGDIAIVGAPYADGLVAESGAAYLFARNQGGADNWGEMKKVFASDATGIGRFGAFVAIDGDLAVAGGYGGAYVFGRNQGGADNWGQIKKVHIAEGAVAVSGDIVLVGEPRSSNGAVHVFARNQGGADNFGLVKAVTVSNSTGYFGSAVALRGDLAAVGDGYFIVVGGTRPANSVWLFGRNEGGADNWGELQRVSASDGAAGNFFGCAVSVTDTTILVGAYGAGANGLASGAAYVFGLGCAAAPCRNGGVCTDGVSSYSCACPAGYAGTNCELDADECNAGTHDCGAHATCTNVPGTFTCACNAGYAGDGRTCIAEAGGSPRSTGCGCRNADASAWGGLLLAFCVALLRRRARSLI